MAQEGRHNLRITQYRQYTMLAYRNYEEWLNGSSFCRFEPL
jgi:hypothetical protein